MLGKRVGEKCCRDVSEVLLKSVVGECCREVLERSVVKKGCGRRVL